MKYYVTLSSALSIYFLIFVTSVYAEFLNTDILKKFFPITGAATEVETVTEIATETTQTPAPTTPAEEITLTTETTPSPEEKPILEPAPPIEVVCPPVLAVMPTCPEGETPVNKFDEKGCLVGYECLPMVKPPEWPPEGVPVPIACPERQTCLDGSTVPCRIEDNKCICDPCPIKEEKIPEGCRQDVDKETGFVKVVCEEFKKCPDEERQVEFKSKCYEQGGNPVPFKDPNGCTFYDCKFGEKQKEETMPNPIYGYEKCPTPEEIDLSIKKCNEVERFGAVSFEGGCRVVKCVKVTEERCKPITAEMRLRIEEGCKEKGLRTIKDFDQNGCEFFACAGEEFCKQDLPKEAFDECRMKGGEMIVKRDERGCVVYSNCIERSDEREVYVEPVEKIPEPTELLSIAFKLEQLKIELDKLARQADDIADYYASVDNPEEHRFRRASSMFTATKDKIDEIKTTLRAKLETLTPEDMEQIRFDMKSLKESLKDIVYVMLSNSNDVKEMIKTEAAQKTPSILPEEITAEGANCGTDGMCFDRAIRVCKPVTFLPEGRAGPTVTIKGLEGDACVLHAEEPEGAGPPGFVGKIYMDCKLTKYSLGVRGPEDVMPYCEGPMRELYEKYGPKPPEGQPGKPQACVGCLNNGICDVGECSECIDCLRR